MRAANQSLVLQYRWRVLEIDDRPHLLYYGVRNPPYHREVMLAVSPGLAARLQDSQPVSQDGSAEIAQLAGQDVLVPVDEQRREVTPETMQVCTRCVTNNYVIPGLEFDEQGVCALCQCYAQTKAPARSAFATVTENELLARAGQNGTRFDAMVLYTGGKDSSYMLWLLARKLGLRVLAAFWSKPYCSEAAYENIRRAKTRMPEVEFIEWTLPLDRVNEAMRAKWRSHGWPCLCPTAAFPLFYPLAAQLRIPYVFLGLEDVQAAVLDYVVAPPQKDVPAPPPSPRDQTLAFLSVRALPRKQKLPVRWPDEMSNYHAAVRNAMPELFGDLSALIEKAQQDPEVFLPLIGRLSTNKEYGTWSDARRIIEEEMGWQAPAGQNSLLHTSCALEPVKDYLQFQRFKAMRTVFMPQSLVEMGAAVSFGMTSRNDALEAVSELGYWQPPAILDHLAGALGIDREDVERAEDELRPGLLEWARLTS